MRFLVTGGCGFIGSNLVSYLLKKGHFVRVIDIKNKFNIKMEKLPEVLSCEITSALLEEDVLKEIDVVFHLAAKVSDYGKKEDFFRINKEGTERMLELSLNAGVKRFVFMSSLAVHRPQNFIEGDENTSLNYFDNPYSYSKIQAENIVREYYEKKNLNTVIIRPGIFPFGAGDWTSFFHVARAIEKGFFIHSGGGNFLLCTSYIENLVDGLYLAGTIKGIDGEVFIITDDCKITWKDFIDKISHFLKVKPSRFSISPSIVRFMGYLMEGIWTILSIKNPPLITKYRARLITHNLHFSCEKAKRILGYKPRIDIDEGIKRSVEWFKSLKERDVIQWSGTLK